MGSSGSIALKGIKWGTICQAFFFFLICPSYLRTVILWIRYLGFLCLFSLLFSQTCYLYKWKISIRLSLPFVLFSSCSFFLTPLSWIRLYRLNGAGGDMFHPFVLQVLSGGTWGRTQWTDSSGTGTVSIMETWVCRTKLRKITKRFCIN